jgi:hypothetical protein
MDGIRPVIVGICVSNFGGRLTLLSFLLQAEINMATAKSAKRKGVLFFILDVSVISWKTEPCPKNRKQT